MLPHNDGFPLIKAAFIHSDWIIQVLCSQKSGKNTHLKQLMWVIKNWITIKGPTFAQSLRTVKARAILNVRSIRDYFAPHLGCQTLREISGTVPE